MLIITDFNNYIPLPPSPKESLLVEDRGLNSQLFCWFVPVEPSPGLWEAHCWSCLDTTKPTTHPDTILNSPLCSYHLSHQPDQIATSLAEWQSASYHIDHTQKKPFQIVDFCFAHILVTHDHAHTTCLWSAFHSSMVLLTQGVCMSIPIPFGWTWSNLITVLLSLVTF